MTSFKSTQTSHSRAVSSPCGCLAFSCLMVSHDSISVEYLSVRYKKGYCLRHCVVLESVKNIVRPAMFV